ncbi:MAG: hypothetical protein KJ056_01515 [Acidimicrobiia bacterium]|nr:hypothetical protein [Acidimicrobiia bacterium]
MRTRRTRRSWTSRRWGVALAGLLVVGMFAEPAAAYGPRPRRGASTPPVRASLVCDSPASFTTGGSPLSEVAPGGWDPTPREAMPDQWLGKLYTEVLGCAPDQASYLHNRSIVAAQGCGVESLSALAAGFLTSRQFRRKAYDPAQRLLVLWRIARESEPDPATFAAQHRQLVTRRTSWGRLVRSFLADGGFAGNVPRLCSGERYGWAPAPAIDLPAGPFDRLLRFLGVVGTGTGRDLQQALDRARPGRTVLLARGAVIRIDEPVTIPAGVRLATLGAPGPDEYAAMARLVRTRTTGRAMLVVSPGATVANVWVDGQRTDPSVGIDHDSIGLQVYAGSGHTMVRDNRISNPAGWSNMVLSTGPGLTSDAPASVTGNLFTGYSTKFHYSETAGTNDMSTNQWGFADAVSNSYGNTEVAHNRMVDVTDVSVVMFRVGKATGHQRSVAHDNVVVNVGNSGWAAFTVDQLAGPGGPWDFSGTEIRHNLVWTSPNASLLTVAGIGTEPWFGDVVGHGTGPVRFVDNTTGGVRINTQSAFMVSRMSDVTATGNTILALRRQHSACPAGYVTVDEAPGLVIDVPYEEVSYPWFPQIPAWSRGCLVAHL